MKDKKIPKTKTDETLRFWQSQIEAANSYLESYVTRGEKIEQRYRDESRNKQQRDIASGNFLSMYNILYSNTETILPILFSETPEVDVRAADTTSMPARESAKMLEDVLTYNAKSPETIDAIERCVKDLLLPGTGIMRVMYNPVIEEKDKEIITDDGEIGEEKEEKLLFEELEYRHIHWKDFIYPECRSWESLPWIAFRGLYTAAEAKEEFGAKLAGELEYSYQDNTKKDSGYNKPIDNKFGLALVWEVWDKTNRQVLWISEGKTIRSPLRIDDDPLDLDDFYPVPKPLFAATTTGEIKPIPMFVFYQDLANELDEVSTRIRRNIDNLRRRGVYDASFKDLEQLSSASDNQFVPIKDFSKLQAKGGIKGVMDFEDLTAAIAVIESLYKQRQEIIQAIYQVMGFADILRGQSDPRETLGAQRIKGRFGTLRISKFQRDVQRFIRDAFRIGGQIVVNQYEDRTIALQTGVDIDKVKVFKEILQQTEPASVLVDIQTDSTIAADDIADKQDIIEFSSAITDFAERTPVMVQTLGLKATSDLLMILLKKFKMGRDIEQSVIDRVNEVAKQTEEAKKTPPPPSPEELKEKREMLELQINTQLKQAELQLKSKELDIRAGEIGLKDQIEQQKLNFTGVEIALKQLALEAEIANPADNAIVGV